MLRLITFLEEAAGVELVLPVTPSSYQWAHEAAIETVTVDQLGDLNFFGGKRMGSTTLHDCLLPAQAYPFLSPGAGTNPWLYLEQLERWVDKGTVVRWLVSGTPVNAAVLLEGVTYREQDGTNDLYADITLRQYTRPETPVLPAEPSASGAGTATSRDSATGTATAKTCTVASGDTLWGICRRYYGDGSLAWRLAAAHGLANALMLSYVIEYNGTDQPTKQGMLPQYKYPWVKGRYARIADMLHLADDLEGDSPEIRGQKMARLVVAIEQLKKDCHIPASIREAGVSESDFLAKLDVMAEHAFDDQCTVANCRYPLISELKELYRKAFYGEPPVSLRGVTLK